MTAKYDLLISYGRDDDEDFVERVFHDLEAHGLSVWWDRQCMPGRGLTFLQEIRDAIDASDRVLAVVGPAAAASEYVLAEWEWAALFGKAVVPVLRIGEYESLPASLAGFHCTDFRSDEQYSAALEELLRILDEPVSPLGELYNVPSLPAHFVARQEDLERLTDAVLADVRTPTVITAARQTTGLHGMGGIGKSVLAASFARSTEARRAFTDGVVWLTSGQTPDVLRQFQTVGGLLDYPYDPAMYGDLESARSRLARAVNGKSLLIVLDDLWETRDAEPFANALGSRGRLLATTRDSSVVAGLGSLEYQVDLLSDEAALRLLADWVECDLGELPPVAAEVARECGNLPFALALAGAMARADTPWDELLEALTERDLGFMEQRFPNYPYPDVLRMLEVSFAALRRTDPAAAQRYMELAVFPADEAVPEPVVVTLWSAANGLQERDARKLLTRLSQKALVYLEGAAPERRVSLHDLQRDYLQIIAGDRTALHARLLTAYERSYPNGWATVRNDGYFFEHYANHLAAAGRCEQLVEWIRSDDTAELYSGLGLVDDLLAGLDKASAEVCRLADGDANGEEDWTWLYWLIRLRFEAETLTAALAKAPFDPGVKLDGIEHLPPARVRDRLVGAIRNVNAGGGNRQEREDLHSLMKELASGDDELLGAGVYCLASHEPDLAWDLGRRLDSEHARARALALCAFRAEALGADEIFAEVERLSNESDRASLLAHGARHLQQVSAEAFREFAGRMFDGQLEIVPLTVFFEQLDEDRTEDRDAIIRYLLTLAGQHSLSPARREFLRTALLLARSTPSPSEYLDAAEEVASRVGTDDNDFKSWALFDVAIEWAAAGAREDAPSRQLVHMAMEVAVESLIEARFAVPVAAGLAVIAAHCPLAEYALPMLGRSVLLLPECRDAVGHGKIALEDWPFRCVDPRSWDLVRAAEAHMYLRRFVAALLYGEFDRHGIQETVASLSPVVREQFETDWARDLRPGQWRALALAALTGRPGEAAAVAPITSDSMPPMTALPSSMEPLDCPMPTPSILTEVEAGGPEQGLRERRHSSRRALAERIREALETEAPVAEGVPPPAASPLGAAHEPMSPAAVAARIDELPTVLAECGLLGRGFRDDYMLQAMRPIFDAWRTMSLADAAPLVDRLVGIVDQIWSGKRSDFKLEIVRAASAADAELGYQTMQRLLPRSAHDRQQVFLFRLESCGKTDIDEAVELLDRLHGSGRSSTGLRHVASYLPSCSTAQASSLERALQRALSRMSVGYSLNRALIGIADVATQLGPKEASVLIAATFGTLRSARLSASDEVWGALLAAVVPSLDGGDLARVLVAYPGPLAAMISVQTKLPAPARAAVRRAVSS